MCKRKKMINWEEYIDVNPSILLGKPALKGTRLSVEFIMERLANGWTELEILENYPSLSENSIKAVYAYVYDMMKETMIYQVEKQRA